MTLAGSGWWDWFMGVCRGACNTGWIGAMGLIYGIRHGGTRLDRGDGIDLRGHAIGMWRWLGHVMGTRLNQRDGIFFVGACHGGGGGVFHGGRNWIGAMELICGGEPWGRMTLARSGWGDWFMWARHEGVRHWLDWGYGIDPWARVKWQSTIWLLNVNDKVLYGCWM